MTSENGRRTGDVSMGRHGNNERERSEDTTRDGNCAEQVCGRVGEAMKLKWEKSEHNESLRAASSWHDEGSPIYHEIYPVKGGGFVLGGELHPITAIYKTVGAAKKAAQESESKGAPNE